MRMRKIGLPAGPVGEGEAAEEGGVSVSHYTGKMQNANPHPCPNHTPEDWPGIDLDVGPGTTLLYGHSWFCRLHFSLRVGI